MKPRTVLAALALLLPALSHAAGDAGSCRYVPVAKLPIAYSDAAHRAIVMGTVNGKPARMIIDTGIYETFLSRAGAERLGLPLDTHSGKASIQVLGNSGRIDGDALVGADFLRAHRILFAMSQDRLYMSYLGGDPFPPRIVRTAPKAP